MRVELIWISAEIEYIFIPYEYKISLLDIFQIFNKEPFINLDL
jgi:hypothetical protein